MVADRTVAWLLTALFAVVAVGYVHAAVRRGRAADVRSVVDDVLHVLMAVAMIAMLWPGRTAVPVTVYVLVFTAGALSFVARALFATDGVAGHRGPPWAPWYHAAMMGSMVFMAVAMAVVMSPSTFVFAAAGASTAMSGMDMAGMDVAGAGLVDSGEAWVQVPSLVLALAYVVAAVAWAATCLRRRGPLTAGVSGGLMAAGMAAVFVQMV